MKKRNRRNNVLRDDTIQSGVEWLAVAIIEKAIDDYKLMLDGVKIEKCSLDEVEEFFRSEWFLILNPSKVSGEEIIRIVRKVVRKEWERRKTLNARSKHS